MPVLCVSNVCEEVHHGCVCLYNPTVTFISVIIMSLQLPYNGSPRVSSMKLFSDVVHHTQGHEGMFIELLMECNSLRGHRCYDDVRKLFYFFFFWSVGFVIQSLSRFPII